MQLVSKRNFLLLMAGIMVVLMGYMAMSLSKRRSKPQRQLTQYEKEIQQIQTQSSSDEIGAIEKDLNETDLVDIDKELQDIEEEIESILD